MLREERLLGEKLLKKDSGAPLSPLTEIFYKCPCFAGGASLHFRVLSATLERAVCDGLFDKVVKGLGNAELGRLADGEERGVMRDEISKDEVAVLRGKAGVSPELLVLLGGSGRGTSLPIVRHGDGRLELHGKLPGSPAERWKNRFGLSNSLRSCDEVNKWKEYANPLFAHGLVRVNEDEKAAFAPPEGERLFLVSDFL